MYNTSTCIYSLKSIPNATFSNQEHVIPACIGGKKKLPTGYVSDEVNALFSKLELEFARKTEIAWMRAVYGPGKRGSLSLQNATESEIHIVEDINGGNIGLGYIKLGEPYGVNSIFINKNSGEVRFSLQPKEDVTHDKLFINFLDQLKSLCVDKPVNVIPNDRLSESEYILGFHSGKWYIAYNPIQNVETVVQGMSQFVSAVIEQTPNEKVNEMREGIKNLSIHSSQITMDMSTKFNVNDYYRILAKIALNCLAHLKGDDFVLQSEFDSIRKAIYNGEAMGKYFDQMIYNTKNIFDKEQGSFGDIFRHTESQIGQNLLSDHYHCIFFFSVLGKQKCAIGLYGFDRPHILNLAEATTEPVFDAFICNWRTETEMDLLSYIMSFHTKIDKSNEE